MKRGGGIHQTGLGAAKGETRSHAREMLTVPEHSQEAECKYHIEKLACRILDRAAVRDT